MHTRKHHKAGQWAKANMPEALRRRRAKADARREALARTLGPVYIEPEPLTHWQRVVIDLYVPTSGRCDQHAALIDGEHAGLLSASQIGVEVRRRIKPRPSTRIMADWRRDEGYTERDEIDAMSA